MLEDARLRLAGNRQELQTVNGLIADVQQQIDRLRRGLTDNPATTAPPGSSPDPAGGSTAPPQTPPGDGGSQP